MRFINEYSRKPAFLAVFVGRFGGQCALQKVGARGSESRFGGEEENRDFSVAEAGDHVLPFVGGG
ncbi:hypothetical protein D3C73_1351600 [compost metagenome]